MGVTRTPRRPAVRPVDKFDERRVQLAESALLTLGELGYAGASLREIASNSPFSHGVVHYYFRDKLELVIYSVRHYKARCVHRYDVVVETSTTAEELLSGFIAKLVETVRDEAPMHRVWYDLRTQSMFEPGLREAVALIDESLARMVWRIVSTYAELFGREVALSPSSVYAIFDGLFQQVLLAYTTDPAVLALLDGEVRAVMPRLLT